MESVSVYQRLRPSRYAFIIDEDNLDTALLAVALNTALWGGVYNPIVPIGPAENLAATLQAFDPDFLVVLSEAELPGELSERYCRRIVSRYDLTRADSRTGRRVLGFGFDILPVLHHVHQNEVRFSVQPTRAVIPKPEAVTGWQEFIGFAHGSFQWLPEMDTQYEELFRNLLHARNVSVPELTPLPDQETSLSPLDFSGHGLRLLGGSGNVSSHVIYVGNHLALSDLLEFWNMRATGRTVAFVPFANYQAFEASVRMTAAEGHYPINRGTDNDADLQRGHSLSDDSFREVCEWIATLGVGQLPQRRWSPGFGQETEWYVGDISVAEVEASSHEGFAILDGTQMTPVKLITPQYVWRDPMSELRACWTVEVTLLAGYSKHDLMFSFPNEPAVERVVQRALAGGQGEVRLGRRGIVLQGLQDFGRPNFHLMPIKTRDVFEALFQQADLKIWPSQPGEYADQIIRKMGSLHGDCRVFKIKGVREILDRLGDGSVLTKGNMYETVTRAVPDELGQNWRPELYDDLILQHGQREPLKFSTIFDVTSRKANSPSWVCLPVPDLPQG